jgi:hypothetical protein
MELANRAIDVGLSTNNIGPMLRFWQNDADLRLDNVLPVRRGQKQYRHEVAGSVIKINHYADQLPAAPPSGYRELIIASSDRIKSEHVADPDGNRVCLVPSGHQKINQIAVRLFVRNLGAHRRFYAVALGLAEEPMTGGAAYRAGESLIILEERPDIPLDVGYQGSGWRYITFQVSRLMKFLLKRLPPAPVGAWRPSRSEMLHESQ